MSTVRLTVAQALVRFLANQYSERDGVEHRRFRAASGSSAMATLPASLRARAATRLTAIHIETDMLAPVLLSNSWWDVPVSEVAQMDNTHQARKVYEAHKTEQRDFLAPVTKDSQP